MHVRRNHQHAYVSVNDEQCWAKKLSTDGSTECGNAGAGHGDQSVSLQCRAEAVDGKLVVRVHTSHKTENQDASFAIDNVLVTKLFTVVKSTFDNVNDFEGWNCGKITSCGTYGNVCGGVNTKGKDSKITKTFDVPAGTYRVTLDFIKIDSWFVL